MLRAHDVEEAVIARLMGGNTIDLFDIKVSVSAGK